MAVFPHLQPQNRTELHLPKSYSRAFFRLKIPHENIKKITKSYVLLLLSCACFIAHQMWSLWSPSSIPSWISSYLDPVLSVLIIAEFRKMEWRIFPKAQLNISQDTNYIMAVAILMAVVGEGLFPALSPKFTADVLDLVAYAIGALIWLTVTRFQNKSTLGGEKNNERCIPD